MLGNTYLGYLTFGSSSLPSLSSDEITIVCSLLIFITCKTVDGKQQKCLKPLRGQSPSSTTNKAQHEALSKDHEIPHHETYCPLVTSCRVATFCIIIIGGNDCHSYVRVCAYPKAACTEKATRLLEHELNMRL